MLLKFIQYLKNLLKRVVPPSINIFHRDLSSILSILNQQQTKLAKLQQHLIQSDTQQANLSKRLDKLIYENQQREKELAQQYLNIIELSNLLTKSFDKLKEKQEDQIKQIKQAIPNKPIYWNNKYEKNIVIANWGNVFEKDDFADKFIKLTRGMDTTSIQTIIRMLVRQKKYLNSKEEQLDFFTRAEQEELRLLNENFYSEILKLSDDLFVYKNYFLPVNHFEPSVFYFKHGLNELETLDSVKGKSVIDVGGFIGDSVLVLSELNPDKIYTFEAMPDNFELLKKTISINHIMNVVAENCALGASAGICMMHGAGSGSTLIDRPGIKYQEDLEVPVITLDEYVAAHNINVGLIKVDIEGGEPGFLEGAKQTICSQTPILLLSIYHNAHDFFELKPLIESWNAGYKFRIHKPTYGSATGETLLLAEIR